MKKKSAICVGTLAVLAAVGLFMNNPFFAEDVAEKERLVDLYLTATVYDTYGEKIYIGSNDNIQLFNEENIIPFTLDNGSISASVALYEYDEPSEYSEKNIIVDSSIHSVTINNDTAFLDIEPWMFEATKDSESLNVEMTDYILNIEGYDGCVVEWNITKELEQEFVDENGNVTSLNVTMGDLYEKEPYEMCYGDASIIRYTAPCNNRGADAYEDEDGYYIQFNMDEDNAFSIAKGTVIDVDDVDKTVAVKYNDGIFIVYGNVSPAVRENDELRRGDLIGYVSNKNLTLRTYDNGNVVTSEWLYDDFERPLEGPNCPRIYQAGQEWSSRVYGHNTIGGGGCGPTSIAMAASGILGRVYTPEDIVDIIEDYDAPGIWYYVKGEGSSYMIFPRVCSVLGLETEYIDTSESAIREQLEDGKMVIVSIAAGRYYHGDGHFILIRGLDSQGNFLINDSSTAFDLNTGYEYSDIRPIKSARTIYKP